ncbi:hypothetical protein [Vibrio sp. 10N.261.46.A3]|uniref:hypothetical protein n=1 Tax=Vibrio sp. 10N.261.46.A3 TaxID=3229658 RepID=UPI0035506931
MSKIELEESPPPKKKQSGISSDVLGTVAKTLGTGQHAQDAVVWLTIVMCFILGSILSLVLICFMWPESPEGVHPPIKPDFPIDEIKEVWGVFIPIVTIALGYIFGKRG